MDFVQLWKAMPWVELIGYAASLTVFATFCMSTMLPLRVLALASNVLFALYGLFAGIVPVLVLHLALFPINLFRLLQLQSLVREIRSATDRGISIKALLPLMTRRSFPAGTVLFRKGDKADSMYYLAEGSLRIAEIDKVLRKGEVIGEIGIFSPHHLRTASVSCETDCVLYELPEQRAHQLYFQNPSFAFALVQLVVGRLIETHPVLARPAIDPG